MSDSEVTVGEVLRSERNRQWRSARDVSLSAGLSDSVVGKVETGMIDPSLRVFAAIVTELGLRDREIALLVRMAANRTRPRR